MAHLHFARNVYKGGGLKAAARLEYLTSKPEQAYSAAGRQLDYVRQETREDLVSTASLNLPPWANNNPYTFFQSAELYDVRKDADVKRQWTCFEEWKIMLPQELTRAQNEKLIKDLLDVIAGESLPCTYAFHDPKTMDGQQSQPHIHLMISARITDEYTRTPEQHFRRWNAKEPGRGGARKDPAFAPRAGAWPHRLMISDMLNIHLELNGYAAHVHPGSLKSRGIERESELRLTPGESGAYRKHRVVSPKMEQVLRSRQERAPSLHAEKNNGWAYWQERKKFLGLTREMSREEKVARIAALRHGTAEPTPQRSPSRHRVLDAPGVDLDKRWASPLLGNRLSKIYHLPTHLNYGDVNPQNQVRFWTEREAQAAGYRRARNDHYGRGSGVIRTDQARQRQRGQAVQHTQSVPRRLQRLAWQLAKDDEVPRGGRLRVRLHEEEREQGMGC